MLSLVIEFNQNKMKKIIQLLYLIPAIALSQITSFDELKQVNSKDQFFKISIELLSKLDEFRIPTIPHMII